MYRSQKSSLTRKLRRRLRRRIRKVRPHQWLQYFGLFMLMIGAGMVTLAALNI